MENYLNNYTGRVISGLYYSEVIRGQRRYFKKVSPEEIKRRRKRVRFACRTFPKDVEIVAVEKKLSFTVNAIQFYGVVDLVLKYPDGTIEIVDYKTGLRPPVKEQLEIYSIPFTRNRDFSQVNFRLICPDRQCHYRWSLNTEEMAERTQHILGIVNAIMNDSDFTPAIWSRCSQCSVRDMCKYKDIYTSAKRASGKNRILTRVNSACEWKRGVTPPKIAARKSKSHKEKPKKKRGNGLSYSLSRAKNEYECLETKRPIQAGEYHFVNHQGERLCVDAFTELYPERAKQLKGGLAETNKRRDRGLSYSVSRAKNRYECVETKTPIRVGEYHFVNRHGKRLCVDAFTELYPERAKQLKAGVT